MKLWQGITLIIFTITFFWWLACYGYSTPFPPESYKPKPKRCQTCCPALPSITSYYNNLADEGQEYDVITTVNDEIRNLRMKITKKEPRNPIILFDLLDIKSEKEVKDIQGLLYYASFQFPLFAILEDPKYPDSPILRTLDCQVIPIPKDDNPLQLKGDCLFIGVGKFNTVVYQEAPLILNRR